jgi:hypothetical protein
MVDFDISGMSAPALPGWDIYGAAPARFLSTSAQLTKKPLSSENAAQS